jgi:hypothetical protein
MRREISAEAVALIVMAAVIVLAVLFVAGRL